MKTGSPANKTNTDKRTTGFIDELLGCIEANKPERTPFVMDVHPFYCFVMFDPADRRDVPWYVWAT